MSRRNMLSRQTMENCHVIICSKIPSVAEFEKKYRHDLQYSCDEVLRPKAETDVFGRCDQSYITRALPIALVAGVS